MKNRIDVNSLPAFDPAAYLDTSAAGLSAYLKEMASFGDRDLLATALHTVVHAQERTGKPALGRSEEQRAWDMRQALANVRIAEFEPPPEFLADWEALGKGTLSGEVFLERAMARARAIEAESAGKPAESDRP